MMKYYYFKRWKKTMNLSNIKNKIILYILIFFSFVIIIISKVVHRNNKNLKYSEYILKRSKDFNNPLDYENNKFVILRDMNCSAFCGLLSFYFHYLGCLHLYIFKG